MTTLMFALTLTFEVGTVCVSSASTGSVRGVSGNRHPYRDLRASALQPAFPKRTVSSGQRTS